MKIMHRENIINKSISLLVKGAAGIISPTEGLFFGDNGPELPPIFILGLPRGGTTLVYQCLCHCFDLSYTPAITNTFPFAPAFSTWWALRKGLSYESDFKSQYGQTSNSKAPGESTVWNIYLDIDRFYHRVDELSPWKAGSLKKFVGRIERIGPGPFINKNLRNNQRFNLLAELFPLSVFIIVLREPRHVAYSLLRGRIENFGRPDKWFSIKPRNHQELENEAPEGAVVGQVKGIIDDLKLDMATVSKDRFALLSYEEFCEAPAKAMDCFKTFMNAHGVDLVLRQAPPERFVSGPNKTLKLAPQQAAAIDRSAARLFPSAPFKSLPGTWLTPNPRAGAE